MIVFGSDDDKPVSPRDRVAPFGEIAADERNLDCPLEELLNDPERCAAIGLEGGPFCYTDLARQIPF